jgi:hypothetical protein
MAQSMEVDAPASASAERPPSTLYNYVVSAQQPTAVTHAAVGNFMAPGEINLVLRWDRRGVGRCGAVGGVGTTQRRRAAPLRFPAHAASAASRPT